MPDKNFLRPVPTSPLRFRSALLGGPVPVVCVPLTSCSMDGLLSEAGYVASLRPDMVEVRADYWDFIEDTALSVEALKSLRSILNDIPMLLTVRIKAEKGWKDVSETAKFSLYEEAVRHGLADLVDTELVCGPEKIGELKKKLAASGTALVVAYHDLAGTPSEEEIISLMDREVEAGADVAKIVVQPRSEEDVLRFLGAVLSFRRRHPSIPVIASASGPKGRISRLAGGLFGIDLTFASGIKGSNADQMPVSVMRESLAVIYPE